MITAITTPVINKQSSKTAFWSRIPLVSISGWLLIKDASFAMQPGRLVRANPGWTKGCVSLDLNILLNGLKIYRNKCHETLCFDEVS
jgi:hypothetical protein